MNHTIDGKLYETKLSDVCGGCVFEHQSLEFCKDTGAYNICTSQPNVIFINSIQDGSSASYYQLPEDAKELQDLISFKNMNAQVGEAFRSLYRMNDCPHSDAIRNCNKVIFYMQAEIARLKKYGA